MKPETRHLHFHRHRHRPPHPHTLHVRRHSWPPFKLALPSLPPAAEATEATAPAPAAPIADDADPFPHFLSPPASPDSEAYIFDYMTADIAPAPRARRAARARARSLSPHRTPARPPYDAPAPTSPTAQAVRRLRAWMQRMEARYWSHRRAPDDDDGSGAPTPSRKRKAASPPSDVEMADGSGSGSGSGSDDAAPGSPARGRKTLRRSRGSVGGGGGVRSHSRKPRVWRSPPPEMWTVVEEEREDEAMGLGITV